MNNRSVLQNYPLSSKLKSIVLLLIIVLTLISKFVGFVFHQLHLLEEKKSIVVYIKDTPTVINPLFTQNSLSNSFMSKALFRGLVKYNPETQEYQSDLADFVISDDAKEFVFRIKDNQKWSDGDPITINDVLFTYKNVIQNNQFTNLNIKNQFTKVNIVQSRDNEITVTLPSANSFFIEMFTLGILPKHIYKNVSVEQIGQFEDNLVSSTDLTLKKSDIDLDNLSAKYHLESSQQKFVIDISPEIPDGNFDMVIDDSFQATPGFSQYSYVLPQYTALFINMDNSFLSKKIHRQAINDAINKKELQAKLPKETIIAKPFFQFDNIDSIPQTSFSTIKQNLLDSSEYQNLTQNGSIKLSLIATKYEDESLNSKTRAVVDHIQENLKKINIEVVVQLYDFEVFKQILLNKEYDLALFGHDLGANYDSYSFWHSSQRFKNGLNVSSYYNPLTDNLLENLRRESVQAKKIDLAREINKVLNADIPAIFLFTTKKYYFIDNKIKNRKILNNYSHPSDIFYDIEAWQKIN